MGPEGRAGRAAQAHYSTAGRGGQDVRACENTGGRRERAGAKAEAAQGIAGMHGRAEQRARRVREWIARHTRQSKIEGKQLNISPMLLFKCSIALFAIVCGHGMIRYFSIMN